ncbi:hypothetical protein PALB_5950 [Pseudoalteromonas luteoviolacea B = ATCC 29581]|nr:hypothetical protein PALB_5950 [Pseudoalteromonas luteoviolacea B = ATCC 29581]
MLEEHLVDSPEDTYFESFADAKTQAQKLLFIDRTKSKRQLCFYDGPLQDEQELTNLVNLPSSCITKFFEETDYRIPSNILHSNKSLIEHNLTQAKNVRLKQTERIVLDIKSQSVLLQETPRIYFSVDYNGKVVENSYRLLESAFASNGWETYFDINDELTLMDDYRRAKSIAHFKPNVVFTINRVRNELINKDTFHFSWYMDPTLNLYDNSTYSIRTNDFYFYLIENFKDALLLKGIPPHKLEKQSFACDENSFFQQPNIERKNKIIFIGNDYFKVCDPTYLYSNNKKLISTITELFENNQLNKKSLEGIACELLLDGQIKSKEHLEMFIFPAVVRLHILRWLCEVSPIPVEIYGDGWSDYADLKPHYRGILKSKEALRQVCNEAKYSLLAHPEYYYQQRLLESAACGSIPLIFLGTNNRELFSHAESSLIFSNKNELKEILALAKEPRLSPTLISKDLSYSLIVEKVENKIRFYKCINSDYNNKAEVFNV